MFEAIETYRECILACDEEPGSLFFNAILDLSNTYEPISQFNDMLI